MDANGSSQNQVCWAFGKHTFIHSTSLQVASHRIELADHCFENSQLKHGGRAMPLLSIFDLDFFLSHPYQAHLCLSPLMPCWKPTRGWQWYWLYRRQGHSHLLYSIIIYSNACSSADKSWGKLFLSFSDASSTVSPSCEVIHLLWNLWIKGSIPWHSRIGSRNESKQWLHESDHHLIIIFTVLAFKLALKPLPFTPLQLWMELRPCNRLGICTDTQEQG